MPIRQLLFAVLVYLVCFSSARTDEPFFITSTAPIRLLSVNDGEVAPWWQPDTAPAPDSITVIDVFSDHPPRTRTVYDTTHSSYWGTPRIAIIGRFGVVTNHVRRDQWSIQTKAIGSNEVSVVDLNSNGLTITDRLDLDFAPYLAVAHPDGKRLLIGGQGQWLVYDIDQQGKLAELHRTGVDGTVISFALGRDGQTIIASIEISETDWALWQFRLNEDNSITPARQFSSNQFVIDGPFSPQVTPNGRYALVLNGFGMSDGVLDDLLVLDLAEGTVSGRVAQVADGLENLAIHPSGTFIVVACLNEYGSADQSHLAVIDLEGDSPRLLYYLPVERVPQGIEFSADGSALYVGTAQANQIVSYRVTGKNLRRLPGVLVTGYGPIALAISEGSAGLTDQLHTK